MVGRCECLLISWGRNFSNPLMSFACCLVLVSQISCAVGFHFLCLEFMTKPLNLQLSMEAPKIASLWGALRSCGFESLAPTLVGLGITSLNDITFHSGDLGAAGIAQWQIEALIASRTPIRIPRSPRPQ